MSENEHKERSEFDLPDKEFEKAISILSELEQLITIQNAPFPVHMERLAWLKYLHTRLDELRRLEKAADSKE